MEKKRQKKWSEMTPEEQKKAMDEYAKYRAWRQARDLEEQSKKRK